MAIQESGPAPYAPVKAVTDALDAWRENGLPPTAANLGRLGVSENIIPRVINTFRMLDLLDENDRPTRALLDYKEAPSESAKERLAETLRTAYAPIFQVVGADPSRKSPDQLADAFRKNSPDSLRDRMVRLFLGLCIYVGIITEAPTRKRGPKPGRTYNSATKTRPASPAEPPPVWQPPPATKGEQITVTLGAAGTVTLLVDVRWLDLKDETFATLRSITKQLRELSQEYQGVSANGVIS